ncbi:uncharacterized protein LOC128213124 [Mya arenaria]|uniref:uncharacterized protein LOC128213124 n=1 Tax=Mya arenaria TaxID=6604 RepID=UPI0022E71383|nr:uncharacterized protein LOC128213124 [Mya arenaria]
MSMILLLIFILGIKHAVAKEDQGDQSFIAHTALNDLHDDTDIKFIKIDEDNKVTNGDDNMVSNGDDNKVTNGDDNKVTNGDDNKVTNGDDNKVTNGDDNMVSSGDDNKVTNGDDNMVSNMVQLTEGNEEIEKYNSCFMSVANNSASFFKAHLELYEPNFVQFKIKFVVGNRKSSMKPLIEHTENALEPYKWVWTFKSPKSSFPYLKWRSDFGILSFGLLDAKTTRTNLILYVEVPDSECLLKLWDQTTINRFGQALRNMTVNYLSTLNKFYNYSYFCYHSEIRGIRDTVGYRSSIYFGYPYDFERYKCCNTFLSKQNHEIDCSHPPIKRFRDAGQAPFALGLVAFTYFPILLFLIGGKLLAINRKYSRESIPMQDFSTSSYVNIDQSYDNYVYLNGEYPVSAFAILCGLCGLAQKCPFGVSRLRRVLFTLLTPSVIFFQIYIYYIFNYEHIMVLLNRNCPMAYLSMLGGFEKSLNNFMPQFGGPYCLFAGFYIASVVFLILPTSPDKIVQAGTYRYTTFGEISPLFLNIETIEKLSPYPVTNTVGYSRVSLLSLSMFYMVANPKFWSYVIQIQKRRVRGNAGQHRAICILKVLFLPLYIVVCVVELVLCTSYYGFSIVNVLCMVFVGYTVTLLNLLFNASTRRNENSFAFLLSDNIILKVFCCTIVAVTFLYYVISFCSMFLVSFCFVSKLILFCFLAVITFPATSFGYLFFGVVFLYYIVKMFQKFSDGYFELLADAIEASLQLESEVQRTTVIDGTVVIGVENLVEITKLQIGDRTINLSTDQRRAIREGSHLVRKKLHTKDHSFGIPRDLYYLLVEKYRPVYKEVTKTLLKILFILVLIEITLRIVVKDNKGQSEELSEVMHVVFIMVIGALPRILEVALDSVLGSIKKDIEIKKIKGTILEYWANHVPEYCED